MGLDLVVARVAAAWARGHALFSPAPLDVVGGAAGSSQTMTLVSNAVAVSAQSLGAQGRFADSYAEMARRFSGRLAGIAAREATLSGLLG